MKFSDKIYTVGKFKTFLTINVYPQRLFRVDSDIYKIEGTKWPTTAAGQQFALMTGAPDLTYCTLVVARSTKQAPNTCLVDIDRDGFADQVFGVGFVTSFEPVWAPKKHLAIQPVRLNEIERSEYDGPMKINLQVSKISKNQNIVQFDTCRDRDVIHTSVSLGMPVCFGDTVKVNTSILPAGFKILGANFEILSMSNDEISIRQISDIPSMRVVF